MQIVVTLHCLIPHKKQAANTLTTILWIATLAPFNMVDAGKKVDKFPSILTSFQYFEQHNFKKILFMLT
jgi:hypothetical protein